jgi:hypothetical protein
MKTKLICILFFLTIAFSCKKKKEEPTNTSLDNKDFYITSCFLTKENQLLNDTIVGSIEYQYNMYGQLLKRQNLNKEGLPLDSGTYFIYTYEGDKLIIVKDNANKLIGKRSSEPTTIPTNSEFSYSVTEFSYRNDTIISSVSNHFESETSKIPGVRRIYYYAKGNLSSVVSDYTTINSDCKSGGMDSIVFSDYSNGRPKTQITYTANYNCPTSGSVSFIKNSEYRYSYDANMNLTKVETSDAKTNWNLWIQNEYGYDLTISNLFNLGWAFSINSINIFKDYNINLRISEKEYSIYDCNSSEPQSPSLVYFRSDSIKVKNKNGRPELIESSIYSSYCGKIQNYKTQKSYEYTCKKPTDY